VTLSASSVALHTKGTHMRRPVAGSSTPYPAAARHSADDTHVAAPVVALTWRSVGYGHDVHWVAAAPAHP
jgi:hypothetical protein